MNEEKVSNSLSLGAFVREETVIQFATRLFPSTPLSLIDLPPSHISRSFDVMINTYVKSFSVNPSPEPRCIYLLPLLVLNNNME